MSKCCGVERTGNYCSECGKKLALGHTLRDLVTKCRNNQRLYEQKISRNKRYGSDIDNSRDEAIAERWKQWADQVEAMIVGRTSE